MKKKLTVLLIFFGIVGIAIAQSIQGLGPASSQSDGQNTGMTTLYIYPQIQPTIVYNASPTPSPLVPQPTQVSNWLPLNTKQDVLIEAGGNTFTGYYAVQVSNNPTPAATNVSQIHTIMRDDTTYASGGSNSETLQWLYNIAAGWKYMRFVVIPESGNTGTLNLSARVFANDGNVQGLVNTHTYVDGVPWRGSEVVSNNITDAAVTTTNYQDYKLPRSATGLSLFTDVSSVSGAATITTTIYQKDPNTGQLQALAKTAASAVTGVYVLNVAPGYASPYPIATPSNGLTYYSTKLPQDLVIGNAITAPGTITYSQTAQPLQ